MGVGKVFLIGAGPGDPGLITVRGAAALALADVVLYDALAHPALLEHTRPDAERRNVGKRYGEDSFSQDAINGELVALAREGRVVARLKGGDPLLFARGAEELETLSKAGIPFEIVPGVPSPTGAAAYAGISLTHRDLSSSVAFITGTESPGKERTAHDWSKLATATQTLCVIMGMKRLGEITAALVLHGRSPGTPAAAVQWGTWPRQRVVLGTVADIAVRAAAEGIANPAVVIIGEVARLRETMRWFDARPLFGKRVLVTRRESQAAETALALRERGAEPVVAPMIEIVPAPDPVLFERGVRSMADHDFVVFTSVNGVDKVFEKLAGMGRDARAFGRAKVAAIGPATAKALAERGIRADVVAKEFRGEGLAEAILQELAAMPKAPRRALLFRALVARNALPDALRAAGIHVEVVAAYETRSATRESIERIKDELAAGRIDAILFTSSSTVEQTVAALGSQAERLLDRTVVASIGPVTTETAKARGLAVTVTAREYTVPGLLAALEAYFAANPPGVRAP